MDVPKPWYRHSNWGRVVQNHCTVAPFRDGCSENIVLSLVFGTDVPQLQLLQVLQFLQLRFSYFSHFGYLGDLSTFSYFNYFGLSLRV